MKIFIDTDILIDHSKGKNYSLVNLLEKQANNEIELFINAVVIAEFTNDHNLLNQNKYRLAEKFLKFLPRLKLTEK